MKKCYYHIMKSSVSWCAFKPKKPGFHFLRHNKSEWMIWDGSTYIGSVFVYDKNKYGIGFENFENITVNTPVSFSSLRKCANWLTKNSIVAKNERQYMKHERNKKRLEKKAIQTQTLNRKKVSSLAKKLGVSIQFVDKD